MEIICDSRPKFEPDFLSRRRERIDRYSRQPSPLGRFAAFTDSIDRIPRNDFELSRTRPSIEVLGDCNGPLVERNLQRVAICAFARPYRLENVNKSTSSNGNMNFARRASPTILILIHWHVSIALAELRIDSDRFEALTEVLVNLVRNLRKGTLPRRLSISVSRPRC